MPSATNNQEKETTSDKTVDYVEKKGRLHMIPAIAGAERLEWEANRQKRMIQAEDEAVAEAMGWKLPDDEEEGEDVKQTILGDQTTHNTTHVAKGMGALAAAALGAAFPAAGIIGALAWHFLAPQEKPDEHPHVDETVEIGLGKIEDYFPQGEQ